MTTRLVPTALPSLLLVACAATPQHLSPRPTAPGQGEFGLRWGGYRGGEEAEAQPSVSARIGAHERVDFGVQLHLLGGLLDSRLALVRTTYFDLAVIPAAAVWVDPRVLEWGPIFSAGGTSEDPGPTVQGSLHAAAGTRLFDAIGLSGAAGLGTRIVDRTGSQPSVTTRYWSLSGAVEVELVDLVSIASDLFYVSEQADDRGPRSQAVERWGFALALLLKV